MKETETSWSSTRAAMARAKAVDLDRQAREIERTAYSEGWRQRAKVREAANRLRMKAGEHLVTARQLEESSEG